MHKYKSNNFWITLLLLASLVVACTSQEEFSSPSTRLVLTMSPTITHMVSTPLTPVPTTELPIHSTQMSATSVPTSMIARPLLQLTFVSTRSGKYGVYAVDVNCLEKENLCLSEPRLLFEWKKGITGINWSPNGKQIVFTGGLYGGTLLMADWNGNNIVQITKDCDSGEWPRWSPDGTKIAFIYLDGKPGCEGLGEPYIVIYDLNTGQMSRYISSALMPIRINWLPGGWLAYIDNASKTDSSPVIRAVEPDGSVVWQLFGRAQQFKFILDFDFSSNSEKLAFVGEKELLEGKSSVDVYVTDIHESQLINLTDGLGINLNPAYSPLNDWIAFESDRSGDYEIYLEKSDGSHLMRVTQLSSDDGYPAWRIIR